MTITNQTNKISHLGTGEQDDFTFDFLVYDEDDLKVYENGTLTTRPYTIEGVGDPAGGTVTFTDPEDLPESGSTVTIIRELDYVQEVDYEDYIAYSAQVKEQALDRLTMMTQQLSEQIDRSIVLRVDAQLSGLTLPVNPGRVIGWNEDATDLTTYSPEYGPQGERGYQGFQGQIGSQGPQGITGNQGAQGDLGTQGYQGFQGTAGFQGPQGAVGFQGSQGADGIQGAQGGVGA